VAVRGGPAVRRAGAARARRHRHDPDARRQPGPRRGPARRVSDERSGQLDRALGLGRRGVEASGHGARRSGVGARDLARRRGRPPRARGVDRRADRRMVAPAAAGARRRAPSVARPARRAGRVGERALPRRAARRAQGLAEGRAPGDRGNAAHGPAVPALGRRAGPGAARAAPGRAHRRGVPWHRRSRRGRIRRAGGCGGVPVAGGAEEIARRKGEHLQLAAEGDVETRASPGWEDVHFVHDALPTVDAASIDLTTTLLGHTLRLPLVISGMTGGHGRAIAVNELLARVAEKAGIAIGVGSQRAALRDAAPHAFVIANVGISQLVKQEREPALAADDVRHIVKMVRADALALHLNYLEESVQPEGQTRARGSEAAVRALTKASPVPVIAKETGAGISRAVALRLRRLGVSAIDVGGVGGTSFAAIEALRAASAGDVLRMSLGERFRDWGLPTAVAVVGASAVRLPVIATGGVRSGLDAAKALALGATAVGVGRPLLQAAL